MNTEAAFRQLMEVYKTLYSKDLEIDRLNALLKERSCCCSGCTKHNMELEDKAENGVIDGNGN